MHNDLGAERSELLAEPLDALELHHQMPGPPDGIEVRRDRPKPNAQEPRCRGSEENHLVPSFKAVATRPKAANASFQSPAITPFRSPQPLMVGWPSSERRM